MFLASAILFGPFSHGSKIHISPRLQKGKSHCENWLHFLFFWKITAGLYGWPTVLFSSIFPYCCPWLQAIYVPVKLKIQHPPRANSWHFTVHRAREGGNLNVALEGWGIWTRFISSSSVICPWVFSVFAGLTDFQSRISPLLVNRITRSKGSLNEVWRCHYGISLSDKREQCLIEDEICLWGEVFQY